MAGDTAKRDDPLQIFDCDSMPIPPGTKRGARKLIDGEPGPTWKGMSWIVAAVAVAALAVGVLLGRLM